MNKNLLIGLGVIGLLLVGYLVFSRQSQTVPSMVDTVAEDTMESESMMEGEITVSLSEQNDSGESGTATLTEIDGQVVVSLSMQGSPEDVPQPAHIHTGSCPDVGSVSYPLSNVVNGESEMTLDVTLAQLESELPLAINVHKSIPESGVYTSCGDLEF